jgi:hypothetical protein
MQTRQRAGLRWVFGAPHAAVTRHDGGSMDFRWSAAQAQPLRRARRARRWRSVHEARHETPPGWGNIDDHNRGWLPHDYARDTNRKLPHSGFRAFPEVVARLVTRFETMPSSPTAQAWRNIAMRRTSYPLGGGEGRQLLTRADAEMSRLRAERLRSRGRRSGRARASFRTASSPVRSYQRARAELSVLHFR